jgi:hypothetical protein
MTTSQNNKGGSHFPQDLAALLGVYWIILPIAALSAVMFSGIQAVKSNGDLTLLWIALGLGCVGVVVLFVARFPLYRQRRFCQIGPKGLDAFHKRLYVLAWCFLGLSISLFTLLLILVR